MRRLAATVRARELAKQVLEALDRRALGLALDEHAEPPEKVAGDYRIDALLTEFDREWREAKR